MEERIVVYKTATKCLRVGGCCGFREKGVLGKMGGGAGGSRVQMRGPRGGGKADPWSRKPRLPSSCTHLGPKAQERGPPGPVELQFPCNVQLCLKCWYVLHSSPCWRHVEHPKNALSC